MHVLVLPSWYPTTEAPLDGIYFAEQARCLQAHGLDVGVVYPEHQSLRRLTPRRLRRKHFQTEWTTEHGLPTLRRYGWNVWWRFPPGVRCRVRTAVRLARRYVERRGVPDVVHAHSARWAGAAAARVQEALGVPYVLTEHFSGFRRASIRPWRRSLVERGLSRARGLAAVSTTLKDALVAQGLAAPEDVAVHPNLVRTSFFVRPSEGRPAKPPFRLVTVAGLNSRKNVAGLIEAFARAFGAAEATSLTIVGEGPRRPALEEQARRLDVAPRVAFLGRRDRAGVRDALQAAHAFVLPSRHETFGVALAEAMATGLPVVATRCGGPEDLVTEATGLLVPPEDPAALAEALRTMRARWAMYDPERIRASVVDRCGPEPFARRTRSFYHRALSA